jgi:hypothetical protein
MDVLLCVGPEAEGARVSALLVHHFQKEWGRNLLDTLPFQISDGQSPDWLEYLWVKARADRVWYVYQ